MERAYSEFDLHGHVKYSAFPSTISYSSEEVIIRSKEVGLSGVAITGHDTIDGLDEGINAAVKHGLIFVPGIEITSRMGSKTPHILALGITPDVVGRSKHNIPRYKDPVTVTSWIHDHGGIAIAAHPNRRWHYTSFSYEQLKEYQAILDGIEVITLRGRNRELEVMAEGFNISGLGSSDFHALDEIGLVGTKVFGSHSDYRDVLKAIKEKRVEAFIRRDLPSDL